MQSWIRKFMLAFGMLWCIGLFAAIVVNPEYGEPEQSTPPQSAATTPYEGTITLLTAGERRELQFSEYLTGVLLCEIPADFHPEAKKAQAIVARTYASRVANVGIKHGPGVVCGDPACCQGYISPQDYQTKWGVTGPVESAREAVLDTEGLVVTYHGELVDATYFSCSGGQTEDAVAVWGADIPYLRSVESPGEENADHYWHTVRYTPAAFCDALHVQLSGDPSNWFGGVSYTRGGGVAQMIIGGKAYTGTHLRNTLKLRSTCFSVKADGDTIEITTRGFGHRVGMSQYGADAMATGGSTCEDIIKHYYNGVEIQHLWDVEQ